MTRRRLLWLVPTAVVLAALAYTAFLAWQVQSDLRSAEASASDLKAAWRDGDQAEREQAASDLATSAASAQEHTSGVWWRAMGHLPFVGDDVDGVAAMSRSLQVISSQVVTPLGATLDDLDGLVSDGRIDLDAVQSMQQPLAQAQAALIVADDELAGRDSSGYVGALQTRFDDYADLVHSLRTGLHGASKAVTVLPSMAGGDGPKNYLLIFQNNAEIRATGGLPGSWALVRANDGKIQMVRQGADSDFPLTAKPVIPLTDEERAVYGDELGVYFHDAGWTADFPRAAELWRGHWDRKFPDTPIDGVVAIDPVALSYLLDGTGPVTVDDVTLTRGNAVEELLNKPYIDREPAAQNAFFADAAKAVFDAATGSLASPVKFVQGLNRSANEGRLLVHSFDDQTAKDLAGTKVEGALAGDDGTTPHVDIGLNDLTGSKMSYYLRYDAAVDAVTCDDGVQQLEGALTLRQVISPTEAAKLPASVTGGGNYGTAPGAQYVMVRIYGPYGGSIDRVRLDGKRLPGATAQLLNGRPVVSIDVLVSSQDDLVLTWEGATGSGQTDDVRMTVTPSVVPGSGASTALSACA